MTASTVIETCIVIIFSCEDCGRKFEVDDKCLGRRGRCTQCGHVMRISQSVRQAPASREQVPEVMPEPAVMPEAAPFRLSPPDPRPWVHRGVAAPDSDAALPRHAVAPHETAPAIADSQAGGRLTNDEFPSRFELLDDGSDAGTPAGVSPEIERGLREMTEFQKDRGGYELASTPRGFFGRLDRSRRQAGST